MQSRNLGNYVKGQQSKTTKESEDWPELRGKYARINLKPGESSLNSLDSHMLGDREERLDYQKAENCSALLFPSLPQTLRISFKGNTTIQFFPSQRPISGAYTTIICSGLFDPLHLSKS